MLTIRFLAQLPNKITIFMVQTKEKGAENKKNIKKIKKT